MDFTGYDDYRKRVFGFISEFLLKVYCIVNQLKVHESMVGMVGEKKETLEVKTRLEHYIMEKKLSQAKDYFYQVVKKRPDILMEASDINGELKLAMQIISSCEHEYELYQKSILDHIGTYKELKEYFDMVNKITVAKISETLNVSKSCVAHIFKKEMNISIYKYILEKRLILAHNKILDGMPATLVALECGFSDYSGFYKQYKKMFNTAPSYSKKDVRL